MANVREALKQAIWILTTIEENKRNYETRWIGETINACKEALESLEKADARWEEINNKANEAWERATGKKPYGN